MTFIILGDERRRRRKHSSSKAPKTQPVAQNAYASASAVHVQTQNYAPVPAPAQQYAHQGYGYPGYSTSPPQHPIYGAMPQAYQSQQWQGSPPLQPVQPYAGNSAISFAPSHAAREEGRLKASWHKVDKLAAKSYGDLKGTLASGAGKSRTQLQNYENQVQNCLDQSRNLMTKKSTHCLNQGAALCDILSSKLDAVITSIDGECFSGREQDLMISSSPTQDPYPSTSTFQTTTTSRGGPSGLYPNPVYPSTMPPTTSSQKSSNHFSKSWLYSNSRLPPHLPPFKVYLPTYPLLTLAASYSEKVYSPPSPSSTEQETHISSSWRSGTKAMVLKSLAVDDMNVIVFAVRGSATFMDWAVNFRQDPEAPVGFLDDGGNACHAGFLGVARQMIKPVAERLRSLLEANPGRRQASLLITGHSAGGAVAALLYSHMLSTTVTSELNYLTGFFRRVHCVTFGAPPVSLLPLKKPEGKKYRKSLFYAFVNEGDPVPRADKQVVRSLLKLYALPAPSLEKVSKAGCAATAAVMSSLQLAASDATLATASSKPSKFSKQSKASKVSTTSTATLPRWNIPATTLSTAGRLVVMRTKTQQTGHTTGRRKNGGQEGRGDIEAVTIDDEMLREVVFGDPVMHMMEVYRRRVEGLAVGAVMGW